MEYRLPRPNGAAIAIAATWRALHQAAILCEVFPNPQKPGDGGSAGRYTPIRRPPRSRLPVTRNKDPSMYLDIFLIVVMFISGMLAMVRGLIREVLSIAGWGAAAGAAFLAYAKLLPAAKAYFNNDYVAIGVTTAGAFIGTLIIVSVITVKISDKILDSRIGALDRTLGFLFGLARGLLIVVVAFAFYDWFQPKSQPGWIANAKSLVVLKNLRDDIISMSPDIEAWYSRYKKQKESAGDPPA
jgi:membrane protein required for colicin V production